MNLCILYAFATYEYLYLIYINGMMPFGLELAYLCVLKCYLVATYCLIIHLNCSIDVHPVNVLLSIFQSLRDIQIVVSIPALGK